MNNNLKDFSENHLLVHGDKSEVTISELRPVFFIAGLDLHYWMFWFMYLFFKKSSIIRNMLIYFIAKRYKNDATFRYSKLTWLCELLEDKTA